MIVERTADRIAQAIYNKIPEQSSSIPVLRYGMIIVLNTALTIGFAMGLGSVLGKPGETAIVLLVIALLRMISGGFHFSASKWCTLFTTGTVVLIPHVVLTSVSYWVLAICSILLFLWFSPSNLEKQSRIPRKYYPVLKIISVGVVVVGVVLNWDIILCSIFVQALSLIRFERG